jgi:hypothetical protein
MFPKILFSIAWLLVAALPSGFAQDRGRRVELEDSLESRYRLTVLGGGFMGARGGDNAVRRAGGVVITVQDGMYGSYNRGKLASNVVLNGKMTVVSGNKDVAVRTGEKFYVTAVHVGLDVVTLGLLSARMFPGTGKASQLWCTANFFFEEESLAQGDIGKVYSAIDQWLLPEGATASAAPPVLQATSVSRPAVSAAASESIDLKPGMTREQLVTALGAPVQDAGFGERRWLTYPGITVTLEQGKLISVDRNAQALVPVKISSEPVGADVFWDGSFVSSTPAVLRMPAGNYKVAVKMSGYADWEREIKILPGAEVSVNAVLSK